MTSTLFDLTGEALQIQNRINQAAEQLFSDDPAQVSQATAELEALIVDEATNRQQLENKADAWCWVIDRLRAQAISRAEHARRLSELAKSAEHEADVLQDRLIAALQRIDPEQTSWKLLDHKISSRRVTSVELDPELQITDLPDQYQRTKTTVSADKSALGKALKAGEQIPGVQLVERRSWTIC